MRHHIKVMDKWLCLSSCVLAPLDARLINASFLLIERTLHNMHTSEQEWPEFDTKPNNMSTKHSWSGSSKITAASVCVCVNCSAAGYTHYLSPLLLPHSHTVTLTHTCSVWCGAHYTCKATWNKGSSGRQGLHRRNWVKRWGEWTVGACGCLLPW